MLFESITTSQKIMFICHNHMLYNSPEKVSNIMKKMNISSNEFDISSLSWYKSAAWWKNQDFIKSLNANGIKNFDIIIH